MSGSDSMETGFCGGFLFMNRTPLWDCVRCPLRASSETGQYLAALAKASSCQELKFLAWMAASHMDLTGKPAAAWRQQMRAPMLGRSWASRVEGAERHFVGIYGCAWVSREKRQSSALVNSRQPRRMNTLFWENTMTAVFSNKTLQSWSQSFPIPIRL